MATKSSKQARVVWTGEVVPGRTNPVTDYVLSRLKSGSGVVCITSTNPPRDWSGGVDHPYLTVPLRERVVPDGLVDRFACGEPSGDLSLVVTGVSFSLCFRWESDQADRAISKAQLHALLHFHMPPIDVVVYHGS